MSDIHVHQYKDLGIYLFRYYIDNPDEVGSISEWGLLFKNLWSEIPFREIFDGWVFKVYHYDHPNIDPKVFDFDPIKPGDQKVSGLTNSERSFVVVYPNTYWSDGKNYQPENPREVGKFLFFSKMIMHHEFGHWYARQCNFWGNSSINKHIRSAFDRLYSAEDRYSNYPEKTSKERKTKLSERFAEFFIPGFYSPGKDRRNNKVNIPDSLLTLVKLMYWLDKNLRHKNITSFKTNRSSVQWCEETLEWFFFRKKHYFYINNKFQLFKWNGKSWALQ